MEAGETGSNGKNKCKDPAKLPDDLFLLILDYLSASFAQLGAMSQVSPKWLILLNNLAKPLNPGIVTGSQLESLASTITPNPISHLSRHIVSYNAEENAYENGDLQLLQLRPSRIHRLFSLNIHLKQLAVNVLAPLAEDPRTPLYFPQQLTHLKVQIPISNVVNHIIHVVSMYLPLLQDFRLLLLPGAYISTINFGPLSADSRTSTTPLEFYFEFPDGEVRLEVGDYTAQQIKDVRALKQQRVPCSINYNRRFVRRLLEQPHREWTALSHEEKSGGLKQTDAEFLIKLVNLKQFSFRMGDAPGFRDANFLLQIRNLTGLTDLAVEMKIHHGHHEPALLQSLMTSLQHLIQLTRLSISSSQQLDSNHLTTLLRQLPLLQTLELHKCRNITSFQFLTDSQPANIVQVHIIDGSLQLMSVDQVQHLDNLPPRFQKLQVHFQHDMPHFPFFNPADWQPIADALRIAGGELSLRFGTHYLLDPLHPQ